MDPASAAGIASGSIAITKILGETVLSVKTMVQGIKDIDESTQGLSEELGAFEFSLTILNYELRKGSMMPEIQEWWQPARLDVLLNNPMKTFSRLEGIFSEIHRRRKLLQNVREYYRMSRYDEEMRHLRLRISTYMTALNVPVVLLAIRGNQDPSPLPQHDMSYNILGDRIHQLEQSIDNVSSDIRLPVTNRITEISGQPSVAQENMQQDSAELIQVARSLVVGASSVARTASVGSAASTARGISPLRTIIPIADVEDQDSGSMSVRGIPLSTPARTRVRDWIQSAETVSLSSECSTIESLSSLSLADVSQSTATMYTPASTVIEDDEDVETELAKRRAKKAKELMGEKKYWGALPHLKRIVRDLKLPDDQRSAHEMAKLLAKAWTTQNWEKANKFMEEKKWEKAAETLHHCLWEQEALRSEFHIPGVATREEIQLCMAKALTMSTRELGRAEGILRELHESSQINPLQRMSVAHLLAQLLTTTKPTDWTEAKSLCMTAIKGRMVSLGRKHDSTYESIALLVTICQLSNDSDGELWREMLPEDFNSLPFKKITATSLTDMNRGGWLTREKGDMIEIDSMEIFFNRGDVAWRGRNVRTGSSEMVHPFHVQLTDPMDYVNSPHKLKGLTRRIENFGKAGERFTIVDFRNFHSDNDYLVRARNEKSGVLVELSARILLGSWDLKGMGVETIRN
ncbi:hypothetical protein EJ08DRAFT_700319 [Tothia fuscella]|uniref:Fungal N-terminal domain-containing protein n=1 Tax=Tothia fuscella TaxID=1048955 RepID=A0A9P4NKZ9_9PEZI|nr:hypothetical protein EJ08DRAFT_700319 [Tothia fuscella]